VRFATRPAGSNRAATLEEALERLTPPGSLAECPHELTALVAEGARLFPAGCGHRPQHRIAFALEILEAFFGVATFYYLSRFVSNDELSHALPAGGDYFGFALVGFAFFGYLTVSMSAFDGEYHGSAAGSGTSRPCWSRKHH
jgi:hypothetical protein